MLNIGRGVRREHPKDTSEGVTWPSVITGVAQLPVAHAHTQVTFGNHGTTTKKKAGHAQNLLPVMTASGQGHFRSKGPARVDMVQLPVEHAQNLLPDRASSSHVTDVTSGQKTLLGRIWATSGCACAEHTSGHCTWLMSFPVTWLTSLPVTSLPVMWFPVAHHSTSANMVLSVPIYYLCEMCSGLSHQTQLLHVVFAIFGNNKHFQLKHKTKVLSCFLLVCLPLWILLGLGGKKSNLK